MVNKLFVFYCLSDFLIKFYLFYNYKGKRFFICLLFCGRKVVCIDEFSIIVIDNEGIKLLEFVCLMDCL